MNLLNKVLGIVAGVLLIDHEVRKKDFQQVPYHRYFFSYHLRNSLREFPMTLQPVLRVPDLGSRIEPIELGELSKNFWVYSSLSVGSNLSL